jgi:DNA-binding transcriptional LysR family regulator
MEIRLLRYFVAVAEELHFSRAAARLRIAQPALSHQIRRLEDGLGVTLVNRTKHRVALTAAGEAFLVEARRALAQVERAVRAARRAHRGETGRLAIGFVPSADLDVLPRVLRVWSARFPDVDVELHPLFPAQQVAALRDGRLHVGFVRLPFEHDGLVVEVVVREPLVVALAERHPLARRSRVPIAALRADPLILFPRRVAPAYWDLLVGACTRAGFAPRIVDHSESMQTNLGLVAAGFGMTLVPASTRNLVRAGVVYRPLAPPVPHVEMAVAHRVDDATPTVPVFLQVVREVLRRRRPPARRVATGD